MIKAVIFDCFGVLIGDAYVAIKTDYPELLADPKRAAKWAELSAKSGLGEITSQQRQDAIIAMFAEIGVNGRTALDHATSEIARNTNLLADIKKLRKTYKTGLLSNVGIGFWKRFSREEAEEYFDDIILSYQVGLVKPDPRIFQLAAQRLSVAISECLFLDDDPQNTAAAKQAGMQTITYHWGMNLTEPFKKLGIAL